ncbi:MAG: hypothetical protein M1834_007064 [Cirrosporium novae-zelandiae]|nr:MAG: hypothetical protein M1834_007064 [Cirrosporium novae-zelandiae]
MSSDITNSPTSESSVQSSESVQDSEVDNSAVMFGLPGEKLASCDGHGTLDILKITRILEEAGIPCCLVGTSALRYFGVNRLREWYICIPTAQLDIASSLLKSDPYANDYTPFEPLRVLRLYSLLHTYPRFKCNDISLWFQLIPSQDCHIDCKPSNFERSRMGLPYPKLDIYAQSLLDTYDLVSLHDLVDGMNLSEEWGNEHLDLSGTNDTTWAAQKNELIRAAVPSGDYSCLYELSTTAFSRKETWEVAVRGKEHRLGIKYPKKLFLTRFRLHNDSDPRLSDRIFV